MARGVVPFRFKDEYYYKLRSQENAPGFSPILRVPVLSESPSEQTVAWAIQRSDGGRGFGTTTGHFFTNWENDNYRKLILNAIVWTAGDPVPDGGVNSSFFQEVEVNQALVEKPLSTLVVSGAQDTVLSAAVSSALNSEIPRSEVTETSLKELPRYNIGKYKLVVLSHCNSGGDSVAAKNLKSYVRFGRALVLNDCGYSLSTLDFIANPKTSGEAWATPLKVIIADEGHPAIHNVISYETADYFSSTPLNESGGRVLARVRSQTAGEDPPAAVVYETGRSRIFQLALGRDVKAIAVPGTTPLIRYGSLWAARQ